jgi:hypothetical protein
MGRPPPLELRERVVTFVKGSEQPQLDLGF